jgi:hypothetical protein
LGYFADEDEVSLFSYWGNNEYHPFNEIERKLKKNDASGYKVMPKGY